jgi:sulfofructose kinase
VFHGALLAALQHGFELEHCLRYANLVAFQSCQGLDGRSAIPSHAEVVEALALDASAHERSLT